MGKKNLQCLGCQEAIDKNEAQFVDENSFSFLDRIPTGVEIGCYCYSCFDSKVRSHLDAYNEKMERAKNVNIFFATQSKESRFVRRIEKPVTIDNCDDRDEAILRLAFRAVEANKNSLVDVDLTSTKVRNGSWQSSLWKGRGIPADIEESQLQRRFIGAPN